MPYSDANDKSLPDAVKKLSAKARRIYVSTFNAVYERNGNADTGKAGNAFAIAMRAATNWEKKHGAKAAEESTFAQGEPKEWAFFGPIALAQLKQEMPEWIPIHKIGEYNDPRYGDFSMTNEKFLNAVANFYSCVNRTEAPVDAQVPVDVRHSGDGAVAWLDALTIYGPYLLGKPNWTPKGEEIVSQKLFRFISPLYTEVGDDVLIKEVTLTNRAFLDMPPVDAPILLSADVEAPVILRAVKKEETMKVLDDVTGAGFIALDDGMKLDIYYRLLEYEQVPDELLALEKWTRAFINDLPNAAFAAIEPAYTSGKTDDKNARHLPHHNKSVKKATEDSSVDLAHYRNARARANQIKPVTGSISAKALQSKAQRHLEGHAGVLKKNIKQEEAMTEESKVLEQEAEQEKALVQEEVQIPHTEEAPAEVKALEEHNKQLEQRLLTLERERHAMLVDKHVTAAQKRGVAPIVLKLVRPVMEVCHEDAERIIVLEAEGEQEQKANIFEMLVRLLEECPTRLGEATQAPTGEKPDDKAKEGDQTVAARIKAMEEAMERQYKELKAQGVPNLVAPPGVDG